MFVGRNKLKLNCFLLALFLPAWLCHCAIQPANSFPGYTHVTNNPAILHARTPSPTAYLLTGNSSSLKALHKHYSTHPILRTTSGQRFRGALTRKDWDELSNLYFDANYIEHATAEHDAAEAFCKLAQAGKIVFALQRSTKPHNFTIAIGYNQIPVKVQMVGNNCESASIQPEDYCNYAFSTPYGGGKGLRHPVLDLAEFEQLNKRLLSDAELRLLTSEPGTETFYERAYITNWHCFRVAESEAATQFRNRVIGCSKIEILNTVGTPRVKTGAVKAWGDTKNNVSNWIYYLGYEGIPVRLVIEEGRCVASGILSQRQEEKFFFSMLRRFTSPRPDPSQEKMAQLGLEHGGPEGKTHSQILELYGEPQSIKTDEHGHPVYIYGTGRNSLVEIPIANGKAEGRISFLCKIGWPLKK